VSTSVDSPGRADQIISTSRLHKSFRSPKGPVTAVNRVSIDVHRGEIFGFLGPNGAGKTTTLRMLTTLLPIDDGVATVAGFDVARQADQVRSRIGYVSQLGGSDELATGRENLILQGRLYGGDLESVVRRTDLLIDLLALSEFADRRAKTYSGGQRRRLDIALGIVHEPEVLFLDEPSTGLDPQNRANLWDHIRNLRQGGTTIFLTTHYLEEADALCDRLVIMDHGDIVIEGTPRDLKRQVSGESVVMDIRDGDGTADRALALLGPLPFVREISREGDELRLYVEDGGTALPRILRLLDGEHIPIRSVQLSEPTLDDVFLRQTGRSLRDTGLVTAGEGQA
jgi:ABC-2 type transport system ATP-binding protein